MGMQVRQVAFYTGPGPHKNKRLDDFESLSIDFLSQAHTRLNTAVQELERKSIALTIITVRQYKVRIKHIIKHGNLIQALPKKYSRSPSGKNVPNRVAPDAILCNNNDQEQPHHQHLPPNIYRILPGGSSNQFD